MEWFIISLVPESVLSRDKLGEFFQSLIQDIQDNEAGLPLQTDNISVIYCENRWVNVKNSFKSLHSDFPNCSVLFVVLPYHQCDEFNWIRYFSVNFRLSSQCIILDNVLNNFGTLNVSRELIVEHIIAGIRRKLLIVQRHKEWLKEKKSREAEADDFDDKKVEETCKKVSEAIGAELRITSLKKEITKEDLEKLFNNYDLLTIDLVQDPYFPNYNMAFVNLANDIQLIDCCLHLNGNNPDLNAIPVNTNMMEEFYRIDRQVIHS